MTGTVVRSYHLQCPSAWVHCLEVAMWDRTWVHWSPALHILWAAGDRITGWGRGRMGVGPAATSTAGSCPPGWATWPDTTLHWQNGWYSHDKLQPYPGEGDKGSLFLRCLQWLLLDTAVAVWLPLHPQCPGSRGLGCFSLCPLTTSEVKLLVHLYVLSTGQVIGGLENHHTVTLSSYLTPITLE